MVVCSWTWSVVQENSLVSLQRAVDDGEERAVETRSTPPKKDIRD